MNRFQRHFDEQKALFASNLTRSQAWRVEQLDRMGRMINENESALQEAIAGDFKTASQEYIFETAATFLETEYQKSQLENWMAPSEAPVPKTLARTGHKGMVYRDPYGVVLVIGPFNGPLLLLLRPAITALAAGNTCIAAAVHLTPVLLELGGQNPAVVDRTANIPDAAKKIVWGAMAWGGQWCTSPGYAYVDASIAEVFVSEAKKALVDLYGSDPRNNPDYSRIISPNEVNRLAALIDPARIAYGGGADAEARYLDPTILYPISWDDKIMEDEIFGPILPILTYTNLDEAFARIAATPHPLSAFIFSRDQATIGRFIGELSFGGGAVNQTNINLFIETMPFGGVGPAGIGHYYGRDGYNMLTHAKAMLISPPDVAIEHLFPPYTDQKNRELSTWFDY
jgi:aldehyde dehydrogenase (NAD+)